MSVQNRSRVHTLLCITRSDCTCLFLSGQERPPTSTTRFFFSHVSSSPSWAITHKDNSVQQEQNKLEWLLRTKQLLKPASALGIYSEYDGHNSWAVLTLSCWTISKQALGLKLRAGVACLDQLHNAKIHSCFESCFELCDVQTVQAKRCKNSALMHICAMEWKTRPSKHHFIKLCDIRFHRLDDDDDDYYEDEKDEGDDNEEEAC